MGIIQKEANIGFTDLTGAGAPIADFLSSFKDFTVIVELKRHDTPLFKEKQNRAGSWQLSTELTEGLSQILAQKASWQIKSEVNQQGNFNDQGEPIYQKTVDPKAILIIGSIESLQGTTLERNVKMRTFELFRRDSRNIDILTFDELYERAKHIVDGPPILPPVPTHPLPIDLGFCPTTRLPTLRGGGSRG